MFNAMYGKGNCYDMTVDCYNTQRSDVCSAADNFCYYEVEYTLDQYANRDEYDIREFSTDPFPYEFYVDYLNTPKVQKAIGAYVNYSESSPTISDSFATTGDDDKKQGSIKDVRALINAGVYVIMYNGDADYNCNWLGNQAVVEEVDAPGMAAAGFVNVTTSDNIVNGQVKQSDNFAFVRVFESGHEVPFYQPVLALEMFERALARTDIGTGKTKVAKGQGFKTNGPLVSSYREGISTVQMKKVPADATYNTTTHAPNKPPGKEERSVDLLEKRNKKKRSTKPRPRLASPA